MYSLDDVVSLHGGKEQFAVRCIAVCSLGHGLDFVNVYVYGLRFHLLFPLLLRVNVELDGDAGEGGIFDQMIGQVEQPLFMVGEGCRPLKSYQSLHQVLVADAAHRRVFGTHHLVGVLGSEPSSIAVGGGKKGVAVAVSHHNLDEFVMGRIFEDESFVYLALVHRGVVVLHGIADGLVPRIVGLNDDGAAFAVTASSSRYLHNLLEGAFVGAEVGKRDEIVGTDDTHDADIVEVESFGDHLRAYQYVDIVVFEVVDNLKVPFLLLSTVHVHAGNACFGEQDR